MKAIDNKQKVRKNSPLKSKTTIWNTQRRYVVRFR
jgi:hypothetical protein